jgi:hypothetical protein|tara:strand:+ start:189 stop:431 length:243 start_codon:yes stop_codon:yes gene_type:complete
MCYLAMAEEWGLDKGDKALNQISTHEQVCEQRYLRIEERLASGSRRFDELEAKIDTVSNRLWWIIGLIVVSILVPQFLGG